MKREEILDTAKVCVTKDRTNTYGSPESNFSAIGRMWGIILGDKDVSPHKVALMLAALKMARLLKSPEHEDSWVDLAGYAACGGEIMHIGPEQAQDTRYTGIVTDAAVQPNICWTNANNPDSYSHWGLKNGATPAE